ncbi:MAG: penicillin acylase family protein, partial [Saprospiraceae bacterium]|nr:penicillin acylase family protein [Saprospiraceae bacterium]
NPNPANTQPAVQESVEPFLGENGLMMPIDPQPEKGLGSNNWAVAGSKTTSGAPILCNDPHLGLTLPSIWYMVQIKTPDFNVYGVSLPGAPGVIIGFNEHVAWGVTNVSHDVKDYYAIQWKDKTKKEYIFDSVAREATYVYDTVYIRGQEEPIIDKNIYTHIGPITKSHGGRDLALRWTAHDATMESRTLFNLAKAKNYEDYAKAIKDFSCPAQNIVFACKDGDIALWTQGRLPMRKPQQGRFIQDGSKSSEQWQGFIPQEHIPHEHNPQRGFIGSANQHSTYPSYPYYYYGYFEEYRGRRLNNQLASMDKITVDMMKKLQMDNYSVKGEDFVPTLIKFLRRSELKKEELELLSELQEWDYVYDANSAMPTVLEEWLYQLKVHMYDELDTYNAENKENDQYVNYPPEWHLLNIIKRDTGSFIVDNLTTASVKENIFDIVTESFKKTYETVPREGEEVALWKDVQAPLVQHLASISAFSIADLETGGDGSTLNALEDRYIPNPKDSAQLAAKSKGEIIHSSRRSAGPSWRMVVHLDKVTEAYGIYPGGQSGNPGSKFYADMIKKWEKGDYHRLLYMNKPSDYGDKILIQQKFTK